MRKIKIIMGMTVQVEIVDSHVTEDVFTQVFDYFTSIDETFSTYKSSSEISRINRGELKPKDYSKDMKAVFALSEKTREDTGGYFNIKRNDGMYDPSGLVKGWAIYNAAQFISSLGFHNYYIDAGGDIQVSGKNKNGELWNVGIKNPFNPKEIVKVVYLTTNGIATSGTYERGNHIYNPLDRSSGLDNKDAKNDIVSLSVIGPNIYEADRFATAAFAIGKEGINFIEQKSGLEGYMITTEGIATMTSGFSNFTHV